MKKIINFRNMEEIEQFVKITSNYKNTEVDMRYGKYLVDGKSYLGVLALGVCKDIVMEIPNPERKLIYELQAFNIRDFKL